MGEEIVLSISWNGWLWILFILGVAAGTAAVYYLVVFCKEGKNKKYFIIFFLIFVCLCGISLWQINGPVPADHVAAQEKLQPIEEAFKTHPFYLKESVSEAGFKGEIEGNLGGGFLFIGGSIYGKIESGRTITVVYNDDDIVIDHYVDVHRSVSFPLEEAVIVTIPVGEKPYLMFPEADILKQRKIQDSVSGILKISPGAPHLYLPEGWKIL